MPPRTRVGASARKTSRRRAPSTKPISLKRATPPRKEPAPPRAADPSAKTTGRRRTYYTAEFLAEAKRRIENTLQSTTSIAIDLGMDKTVLWRLVRSEGWVRPEGSLRLRGLSPAMRLAAKADELVQATPTPTLLAGGGSQTASAAPPSPATLDRLESAVIRELSVVERMRANLRGEPMRPMDAERTARTLSVLTETLAKLRRLRLGSAPHAGSDHDDYPADIDAFRREFARRIDAFVASRTDAGRAGAAGPAGRGDSV